MKTEFTKLTKSELAGFNSENSVNSVSTLRLRGKKLIV